MKHQTNISELKRSFLETGGDASGLTEWEKRLSTSPVRSTRLDDSPMIEPLMPEEVSCHAGKRCMVAVETVGGPLRRSAQWLYLLGTIKGSSGGEMWYLKLMKTMSLHPASSSKQYFLADLLAVCKMFYSQCLKIRPKNVQIFNNIYNFI